MGRIRKKFLPEEDKKLRELVEKYGVHSWETISAEMKTRNVRQCRERWKHYLSIDSEKTPWTPEEDAILIQKINELGHKWTKISKFLPGRSDIQIKTRWMKKLKNAKQRIEIPLTIEKKDNSSNKVTDVVKPMNEYEINFEDIFGTDHDQDDLFCDFFDDLSVNF